ncbi:MAG: pyridoxine 5'-phosphate synthase [Candidatus Dadabacteria bacterium]|nr:MAG: pyridoxine 5'-phosphate synthase [Candidatus Dadabacteria bacterium]
MTRIRLGINVDHVATVREARKIAEPDPVQAAILAEQAGADQITVHLREDRRHIQDRDVRVLRDVLHVPLNLEMAATQEMVSVALEVRPDQVTLVPERRQEITTEGGLDVVGNRDNVAYTTRYLRDAGISVALFVDPDLQQIKESRRAGADAIEFHTGSYCNIPRGEDTTAALNQLREACRAAARLGLHVHAGHGLNLRNIEPVARIAEIEEVNIGHSIVARALFVGFPEAVREMREMLDLSRGSA